MARACLSVIAALGTLSARVADGRLWVCGDRLFWTEKVPPAAPPHAGHRLGFILFVLLIVALLAVAVAP